MSDPTPKPTAPEDMNAWLRANAQRPSSRTAEQRLGITAPEETTDND